MRDVPSRYTFAMLDVDDLTDDENDPESQANRPPPPAWSLPENRMVTIAEEAQISHKILDKFFSFDADIDLRAIFPEISKKELKRRSSAIWTTPLYPMPEE